MSAQLTRKTMLGAFLDSDPSYDGLFFTAVRTTGIFCRPTCPAKKPWTATRQGGKVDDAVLDSGYLSHSGFRDAFARGFGTSPGRGHDVEAAALAWIEPPVGPMIAGASDRGVCLLEFADRRMLEAQLT